jgi:hypothetical protein
LIGIKSSCVILQKQKKLILYICIGQTLEARKQTTFKSFQIPKEKMKGKDDGWLPLKEAEATPWEKMYNNLIGT